LYLLPLGIFLVTGWGGGGGGVGVHDTDDLEFSNLIMTLNSQENQPTACLHRIILIFVVIRNFIYVNGFKDANKTNIFSPVIASTEEIESILKC